jgi:mono/diheme cytochrome c family protein
MSMYKFGLSLVLLGSSIALADDVPRLGEELSAEQVAAVNFTILPDGEGLPEGSGNATAGAAIYQANCLACHGEGGENGINDRLVGGRGTINSKTPVKTVGSYWPHATTLFDYIRRAMPFQEPGSLSPDEVYAVTAYILHLNGIVAVNEEIGPDSLPNVKMPNRENFTWAYAQK